MACYNLVHYFTLTMEIGYKEALTWRFSGIGKTYGSTTFSVIALCLVLGVFLRPKNIWEKFNLWEEQRPTRHMCALWSK